jgi:hypothetical protein
MIYSRLLDATRGLMVTSMVCMVCMVLVSEASAGTLTATPNDASCDYLFSGPVEEGDAINIENEIRATSFGSRLCLDSPGGSLTEGLRMFHVIWNKDSIATRVRNGDRCLSACSLAFLGGSMVVGTGAIRTQNAVIEPGAWLGFHAPSLDLRPDNAYEAETVQYAYALALRSSAEMFELTQLEEHGARGMSEFLYLQTLLTPPESMYDIDTIGKANLARIQVQDIPFPELTWGGIRNVCDTAVILSDQNYSRATTVENSFARFTDDGFDGSMRRIDFSDRTWSWKSGYQSNFVMRGYPAPHVSELFCKVTLNNNALQYYQSASPNERELSSQSSQNFTVTLWQDAYVPVDNTFSVYAETNSKEDERISVPWIALWNPMTPLDRFIP